MAVINAVLFKLSAVFCRMIFFPFAVGIIQLILSVGAAFVSVLNISTAASFKLIRTEPAVTLRK